MWNSENLSFNTFKISHHFRYKLQKNTVRQRLMKHLVVLVEKSKLGDIPKFHNFLTSFSDNESSCRGHLGGLHSSSLIFSELIRLIYRFTWLSNTFIRCLFSILRFSRRFTRSLQISLTLQFQPPSNLVCFGKHFHEDEQPSPASIPGKLGSKLPKVSLGQRPCKNQNTIDWTGLHH